MDLEQVVAPLAACGVSGSIAVPPSKSLTQRAIVAAALAGPGARVENPLDAEDPRLLYTGLAAAGWELAWERGAITAHGRRGVAGATVFMGNNGTGMRFLLAQLAATPGVWVLDGVPRLRQRPVGALVTALRRLGAVIAAPPGGASLPLVIYGK
ncbi:MAG: 3-phosphoshikimate 1-carboxyvinyltransferase, partial [Acidobacteriota bacterium]